MSTELSSDPVEVLENTQTMSAANEAVDFPYRAISRSAVVSIICGVFALPGLVQDFAVILALALVGALAAVFAIRATRNYPEEYSGGGLAKFGLVFNLLLLLGGVTLHVHTYMTEVPDGYVRVNFYELQQEENAQQIPTDKAVSINGTDVFLKGYIHPSSGSGLLKHFILVPDLGTCCFGGDPKSSDMVEVTLTGGQTTKANFRKKKLAGRFMVNQAPMSLTDFESGIFYRMRVDQVK